MLPPNLQKHMVCSECFHEDGGDDAVYEEVRDSRSGTVVGR